ncbi:hypothetical protein C6N75_19645 [Streptomyces solincola]|uniref:DUF4097 domain-containing protein n=1 Tax=Streptomyces solincola TaxID=2100817 RepID=A0A2S9PT16_9ACTN|nr:DUF4097 family beta strand repeat-containing protein [Streptomyces solincola]PRH77555.1 hypothetical protein C6N75_19645 [Streptomyces solincola]
MVGRRVISRAVRRSLVAAGGVAAGALALTGCASSDLESAPVERKTFAFDGDTLAVQADDSEVVLVSADVGDVEVSRQVDGWGVFGSGPEPVWRLEDGKLTLAVECDAMISDCAARHEVKVPHGVAVTVDGDNGDLTAEGFGRPLRITSDNGTVTVRDSVGAVDATSNNGDIRVEGKTSEQVTARAENGDVRLALDHAPRKVDLINDNGDVVIEVPGGGAYAVDAHSDNGEVRVGVPTDPDSAHAVRVRTANGDVTVRPAS